MQVHFADARLNALPVPFDNSLLGKEYKYSLSCDSRDCYYTAAIKITRWGLYIKEWSRGFVPECERPFFFCFAKYNNTALLYDYVDDESGGAEEDSECYRHQMRRLTPVTDPTEFTWSVTKEILFLRHLRTLNCGPRNERHDSHKNEIDMNFNGDKAMKATLNFPRKLAY